MSLAGNGSPAKAGLLAVQHKPPAPGVELPKLSCLGADLEHVAGMDCGVCCLPSGWPGRHRRRRLRLRDFVGLRGLCLQQPDNQHNRQAQADEDDAQSRVKRAVGLQIAQRLRHPTLCARGRDRVGPGTGPRHSWKDVSFGTGSGNGCRRVRLAAGSGDRGEGIGPGGGSRQSGREVGPDAGPQERSLVCLCHRSRCALRWLPMLSGLVRRGPAAGQSSKPAIRLRIATARPGARQRSDGVMERWIVGGEG